MENSHLEYFQFHPSKKLQTSKKEKERIQKQSLTYYDYYFLPSAGPKAFISSGFEEFFIRNTKQFHESGPMKWFVGGSTGSLRAFALVSSLIAKKDHTRLLKDHYCSMYYRQGMTGFDLHPMMQEAFTIAAPLDILPNVLDHPNLKIAVIVCRVRYLGNDLPDWCLMIVLRLILFLAWFCNIFNHTWLDLFFERICFYSGTQKPDELVCDTSIRLVPLTVKSTHQVLHATTCIPFVSKPCALIDGVGPGIYLDGGVTDYYLNFSSLKRNKTGLLLADIEPSSYIPRGAFDTLNPFFFLSFTNQDRFERICKMRPSPKFVQSLPSAKLPSVKDWFNPHYIANPHERRLFWDSCYTISKIEWEQSFSKAIASL